MVKRFVLLVSLIAAFVLPSFGQANPPQPDNPNVPQITFELNWRAADPQWYQISIDTTGRASYQSQAQTQPNETPGDPFMLKFNASHKLTKEVFDLAKEADYFSGDVDYHGKEHLANTGTKTLTYSAEGKTNKASFNWSPNPKVQELASTFQQMSTCFELGRKLEYALRFDKLGVDQQLKQLETLERRGYLPGLPVLVPILERVLQDRETMNISRQRANYLLFAAKSEK